MHIMHEVLNYILDASVLLFDYIGIAIILVTGIAGTVHYIKRDPLIRLKLAKGFALGLEFKLGSEILRTVIVGDISEILIVGSIIVLRAALTFLIHWEIRYEESHGIEREEKHTESDAAKTKNMKASSRERPRS